MQLATKWLAVSIPGALLCAFLAHTALSQDVAKQAESRIPVAAVDVADGVRVAVFWDAKNATPVRKVGQRIVKNDEELQALLSFAHEDFLKVKQTDAVVSIDAAGEVPWQQLVVVTTLCKKAGWKRIEFVVP